MTIEFIFVYGTLRKKTATTMYHVLARHCEYVSDGYFQGKLYDVNNYPAAIESTEPHDKVYGELYKIVNTHLVLPQLDDYEECTDKFLEPHEYSRKKLAIILPDGGGSISAWVYIFNYDVSSLIPIHSGDYLNYRNTTA